MLEETKKRLEQEIVLAGGMMAQLHVQLERGPVKVDQSCRRARAARQAEQNVGVWRHSARAVGIRGAR